MRETTTQKKAFFLLVMGLLASLFGLAPSPGASAQSLPPVIVSEFERAGIPREAVATLVQEVESPTPIVSLNTHTPLNPASTMKLVTTSAALDLLGPTYTWKTQAYTLGEVQGDTLRGDLLIKGTGDPKFVFEHLWLFLRKIRAIGIRKIKGNLLLDRSHFKNMPFDPAAFDNEPLRAYNAGPDALLLNFKTLQFQFLPDEANQRVGVHIEPPIADYAVDTPFLSDKACANWKKQMHAMVNDTRIRFDGAYPATCGKKTWGMHQYMMSDNQYFGAVFKQLWRDLGGKFDGKVADGKAPENTLPLVEWTSPPLSQTIRDINKFSNNVMTRQLLLTIAAEIYGPPATVENGTTAIRHWLIRNGIIADELVIENGAGLSRIARISADTMGRILLMNWRSTLMPEFISSLPLAGMDGTMHRRAKNMGVTGHSHIKTGSLKEVRALAGYVLASSGKRYVVVSLINHPHARRGSQAQDALLQWIYENG